MSNVLPGWFRQEDPGSRARDVSGLLEKYRLHTVCKEAACPNSGYCFDRGSATFMILGESCTRNCKFCNVGTAHCAVPTKPVEHYHCRGTACRAPTEYLELDEDEPGRIAALSAELGLDHVVVTSVTRDDLSDGGAGIFSLTTGALRAISPQVKVELLIPDFQGKISALKSALSPAPDVAAHNIETVRRLYRLLRPQAEYRRSLGILKAVKKINSRIISKSSVMLGLGEKTPEVIDTMRIFRAQDCDCLVLGQYLAPSPRHYPVQEFIVPEQFKDYRRIALGMGFRAVLSLPLARSSYRAREVYAQITGSMACTN